jgi:hypothetical protein
MQTVKEKTYTVVYRTGGTLRCEWHRVADTSHAIALKDQAEIERMGYKALIFDTEQLNAVGLPEGWEYKP